MSFRPSFNVRGFAIWQNQLCPAKSANVLRTLCGKSELEELECAAELSSQILAVDSGLLMGVHDPVSRAVIDRETLVCLKTAIAHSRLRHMMKSGELSLVPFDSEVRLGIGANLTFVRKLTGMEGGHELLVKTGPARKKAVFATPRYQ